MRFHLSDDLMLTQFEMSPIERLWVVSHNTLLALLSSQSAASQLMLRRSLIVLNSIRSVILDSGD